MCVSSSGTVNNGISFIPEMQVDFGREGEIYGRNFLNCSLDELEAP